MREKKVKEMSLLFTSSKLFQKWDVHNSQTEHECALNLNWYENDI